MSIPRENFQTFMGDGRPDYGIPESPIDWMSEMPGSPFGKLDSATSTPSDNTRLNVESLADTILATNGFGDGNSRERVKNELLYVIDNGSVWSLARELNTILKARGSDLTVTGEIQPYREWTKGNPPMQYVAGHQAILTINRGDDFVDRVQAMRLKDPNRR